MAININADTTNGLVITSDNSGEINFQAAGSTVAGVNATGLTGNGSQLTGISSYADSDALSLFNASGSAPVYACRAWVNWDINQTIRGSGNVSSITDNGVGKYTVNMTTAMPDTNYSVVMSVGDDGTSQQMYGTGNVNHTPSFSTSSFRVFTANATPTHQDKDHNHVAVFR